MIKANVILDHYKRKSNIKNPINYFKKKLNKLNKIRTLGTKVSGDFFYGKIKYEKNIFFNLSVFIKYRVFTSKRLYF